MYPELDLGRREKEDEERYNPFKFSELNTFSIRLIVTACIIFISVMLIHFWLQFLVIFAMYHVLRQSELLLYHASKSLSETNTIPLTQRSLMTVYGFGNIICAYVCVQILYISISDYQDVADSIVSACLISLFVFLIIGAMKQIAFGFRFFRDCDIENGALGLLTLMSLIIRYIFVTPIWVCFLSDTKFDKIPTSLPTICKLYLIVKVAGFLVLCVDFASSCKIFFGSVILKIPDVRICEKCKNETDKSFMTQCGHTLCPECIDRSRKVNAACPICNAHIDRKWTMPFKFGTIPTAIIFCIL